MSRKQLNTEAIANELRGQSVFFQEKPPGAQLPRRLPDEAEKKSLHATALPQPRTTEVRQSRTVALPKSRTPAVRKSTPEKLVNLDDYPLLDFREYKRVDVRLTWEQKAYLDRLEALIARQAPGVEKTDPLSKRITRSSVLRALVEIARRLRVRVDPSHFRNERDLIEALAGVLKQRFDELESG